MGLPGKYRTAECKNRKQEPKPREEQKKQQNSNIPFRFVFSLTFAVVHHGSTWFTKTNYFQHRNNPKSTYYPKSDRRDYLNLTRPRLVKFN